MLVEECLLVVIHCLNSFKDTNVKIKNMEGEDIPMDDMSTHVNDHEDEINETSTSADRDEEPDRTRYENADEDNEQFNATDERDKLLSTRKNEQKADKIERANGEITAAFPNAIPEEGFLVTVDNKGREVIRFRDGRTKTQIKFGQKEYILYDIDNQGQREIRSDVVDKLTQKFSFIKDQLAAKNSEIANKNSEIARLNKLLKSSTSDTSRLRTDRNKHLDDATRIGNERDRVRDELKTAIQDRDDIQKDLNESEEQVRQFQGAVDDLEKTLGMRAQQRVVMQNELDNLQQDSDS